MKIYRIGIVGCGHIAHKMAKTLSQMVEAECYAVASRCEEKAKKFAEEWNIKKYYGSYEALANDSEIDLIYIATPHSLHYEQAHMCIGKGKPVLCEKAFTANAKQAKDLLHYAKAQNVFITEAMWTRYMPLSLKIQSLIKEGIIGEPYTLSANLSYPIADKERIIQPELAGGALLDIGIYTLNFAAMVFGSEYLEMHSICHKTATGVDGQESIMLLYKGGKMAALQSSIYALSDRMGIISGDNGHIIVNNINNPEWVRIIDKQYQIKEIIQAPTQITGFEYEIKACIEALEKGWLESPYMPHNETISIMEQMDKLRKEWGVIYPCDKF